MSEGGVVWREALPGVSGDVSHRRHSLLAWLARLAALAVLGLTATASRSALARPHDDALLYLPTIQVHRDLRPPAVRILALYYDTLIANEPDEAFQLWNPGRDVAALFGWTVSDGTRQASFPDLLLPPTHTLWCAYNATAFETSFGFRPDCEYGPQTVEYGYPTGAEGRAGFARGGRPPPPRLVGQPLRFTNTGGRLILAYPTGEIVDAVMYKAGPATWGWYGPGVAPWHPTGIAEEGQLIYRKLDETTGRPLTDTDRAADWASDPADPLLGRKVRFPAWDMDALRPRRVDTPAQINVALTPDAGYTLVLDALRGATRSLQMELYTFDHARLADVLAERAQAGVQISLLLEGAPSGGMKDEDRWAASRVAQAGAQVWYMTSAAGGKPRYRSQHAKFVIIDGQRLLLGSENLTPDSLPDDDKGDGTLGRRGVVMLTDQPALVAHAQALFSRDTDLRWRDLVRWNPFDVVYGPPPPGYVPVYTSGGSDYPVQAATPLTAQADRFELIQSPENSLRKSDGLIGLVGRAGRGDTVLVQQLTEPPWWGPPGSNPQTDPNPRVDAYLAAARRGATVRLLLDSFFDDVGEPRANRAACLYANDLAVREGLDLQCRTANPTGLGIHNKMVLVRLGGEGWAHVGSLNGSETSHKINRELALQFRSTPIYDYLARVWAWDWDNGR